MQKVKDLNLPKGKVYYLNKKGDVWQLKPKKKVKSLGLKREKGYIYYIKNGDLYRSKMKRRKR